MDIQDKAFRIDQNLKHTDNSIIPVKRITKDNNGIGYCNRIQKVPPPRLTI